MPIDYQYHLFIGSAFHALYRNYRRPRKTSGLVKLLKGSLSSFARSWVGEVGDDKTKRPGRRARGVSHHNPKGRSTQI